MSDTGTLIPAWALAVVVLGTPLSSVAAFIFGKGSQRGHDSYTLTNLVQRMATVEATQNSSVVTVSNHTQLLQLMANENEKRDKMLGEMREGIATLVERTRPAR